MEISNNLVWVCVLLSMLAIGSIYSQEIAEDEGGESELQEMTNFVQLQQGPISEIGEAQINWPHKHWWGKKKKKAVKKKPRRKVVRHKPKPRRKPKPWKWHPPKNHPNKLPGYDQKYDGPLYKVCNNGKGEGLFHVRSKYDQYYHDRVWDWKCHKVAASPLTDCSWSPYINNWKQPITYMCPKNKFMTGVRSHHKNGAEDRKWKVRCCGAKDYHTEDCVLTDYVNMYHGDMDYKIEAQCGGRIGALVGLESSKWKKTDRRWRYLECSVISDKKEENKIIVY